MSERVASGAGSEAVAAADDAATGTEPGGEVLVRLEGAEKRYVLGGQEVRALRGVSLELRSGGLTFIIGPSGSGKSTLLHLVGALDHPSAGRVFCLGRELASLSERERARYRREQVGFVFQAFHLLPTLDAVGNVLVGKMPVGVTQSDRRRARDLLERLGLGQRLGHRPPELSGGEQQRVAIARALLSEPPLLLADEPTGELDSATGREIMALLRETVGAHSAVVIVTHDTRHIAPGDRVITLGDGRVIEDRVA
jgi:putative ABC transport system ATP-binding protein